MARIAGVDLPRDKRVEIGLTYIYGIGLTLSKEILEKTGINPDTRVRDLTEDEVAKIRAILDEDYKVEGDLRREEALNIKRLIEINSYRGKRHRAGLPLRGQRTKTNARTRQGPRQALHSQLRWQLNKQLKQLWNMAYVRLKYSLKVQAPAVKLQSVHCRLLVSK